MTIDNVISLAPNWLGSAIQSTKQNIINSFQGQDLIDAQSALDDYLYEVANNIQQSSLSNDDYVGNYLDNAIALGKN